MPNSIYFTIGADSSKGIANLKQFKSEVNDTSKQIQAAFGSKLKQIISFAAIEEGVRRTAEWAQEIRQTSQALGVTAEQLQTLQIIASKTGTAESAVVGMFENIQKARDEALKGNTDLMMSFSKLGISMADLANLDTTKLFSKVLGNIPTDIRSGDMATRAAVQNVTGTPENIIASFKGGMGSKSFEQTSNDLASTGEIAKNSDIQEMSAIWSQIVTSLKEAGTELLPIAKFLLVLVKIVVDALGGITETIRDAFDIVMGIVQGDWDKVAAGFQDMGQVLINGILGIVKMIPQIFDTVANALLNGLSKIPGMGKFKDKMKGVTEGWFDKNIDKPLNEYMGTSEKTKQRGQAVGQIAGVLIGAGESNLAKLASGPTRNAAGIASKFGLNSTAESLASLVKKLDSVAQGTGSFIGQPKITPELASEWGKEAGALAQENNIRQLQAFREFMQQKGLAATPNGVERITANGTEAIPQAQLDALKAELKAIQDNIQREVEAPLKAKIRGTFDAINQTRAAAALGALGIAGLLGVGEQDKLKGKGVSPEATKPIIPWNAPGFAMDTLAGGGANLRIGGMFGSGEMKIVRLNEQMVRLLSMIQVNTSYYQSLGNNPAMNNPIGGNAGGL